MLAVLPLLSLVSASVVESQSFLSSSPSKEWVLSHLGNLSPYKKAPVPAGVAESLPSDCEVSQVFYMGRHGSRYPLASELVFIQGLSQKVLAAKGAISNANLPNNLAFLKQGYNTTLGHDDLTAPGRQQLFNHGVDFKFNYPQLNITELIVGGQDRVEESAQWFREGYFGRYWNTTSTFTILPENNVTISYITPLDTCPKWSYSYGNDLVVAWGKRYLPPITKRLNKAVPHFNLTDNDVHGALYACAYDTAAYGYEKSPWCPVFSKNELEDFEYELDLLMYGAFGYGLPGSMGEVLGTVLVNTVIDLFSGSHPASIVSFGHDTTADFALTALGLAKDSPALSPNVSTPPPNRNWRTSDQVPFAAQLVFEKFTCSKSAGTESSQIRLVLNDSPLPLRNCEKSFFDKKYGSCSLDRFVAANKFSTNITWGDATWNSTCGDPGF
ncbi:phosphoglycerate mutase-like protein [Atractiella rhizophila]|nr:phosphoglycerate mutase-like protein [Atractiella rhizophila]